jgi:hypothetical protein
MNGKLEVKFLCLKLIEQAYILLGCILFEIKNIYKIKFLKYSPDMVKVV